MQPRVRVPTTARRGETIEVRTLIEHPMETGLRRDESGRPVPRSMLSRFIARANGETVFAADFRNGSSANPGLTFFVRIDGPTDLEFLWQGEDGRTARTTARVTVA